MGNMNISSCQAERLVTSDKGLGLEFDDDKEVARSDFSEAMMTRFDKDESGDLDKGEIANIYEFTSKGKISEKQAEKAAGKYLDSKGEDCNAVDADTFMNDMFGEDDAYLSAENIADGLSDNMPGAPSCGCDD